MAETMHLGVPLDAGEPGKLAFEVFVQTSMTDEPIRVGSVRAPSAELALQQAKEVFTRRERCHRLMVVPRSAIVATDPEAAPLFDLAYAKAYRTPAYFSRRHRQGEGVEG